MGRDESAFIEGKPTADMKSFSSFFVMKACSGFFVGHPVGHPVGGKSTPYRYMIRLLVEGNGYSVLGQRIWFLLEGDQNEFKS